VGRDKCDNLPMLVEKNAPLQQYNTFGIMARAMNLVRVQAPQDIRDFLAQPPLGASRQVVVLGGGSNIVITGDVEPTVFKMEIMGKRLVEETDKHYIIEVGAGEVCLAQGYPGLENLALIPGTAGAAPVQNIGAYGVELQDRFDSLDAIDLSNGEHFSLQAAQCAFGYRDSVFKHAPAETMPLTMIARATGVAEPRGMGLAGRAVITHVRLRLAKDWKPELGYLDLARKQAEKGIAQPTAQDIFDWVVEIRRAKLPDPAQIGNAGSFFKNPQVTADQCEDIIAREPKIVHYPMLDGSIKLAAGWMIDACGWRGKSIGKAGVYDRQALVLVNLGAGEGSVTGGEVVTLARAIQTSVYERFGIQLEPEPVVW
jgi:UDP-N-acetylmuramate dehydrogenase